MKSSHPVAITILLGMIVTACAPAAAPAPEMAAAGEPTAYPTSTPYPTYTPDPTSTAPAKASSTAETPLATLPPPSVSTESAPTTALGGMTWELFKDPVTGVSFSYPSDWKRIDEPHIVILEADPGAVVFEREVILNDELEQVAKDMFELDSNYTEISRLQLFDPVGYMSTGHFENESEELVRFLLAYPGYGIMQWEVVAPERSLLDEHLIIFEEILASVTVPVTGTEAQDGGADPVKTESSVEFAWNTPNLDLLSEHPQISCLNDVFSVFIDVFGVYLVATAEAPLDLVVHSANVLAQYIDNDADGMPDDLDVLEHLVNTKFVVPVWSNSDEEKFFEEGRGADCEKNVTMPAGMYYDEDEWALGGIQTAGTWDTNLEEIWHGVSVGWYASYPDYFGDSLTVSSMLTDAMDVARGGRFFSIPERYPGNAWYTYDDETCDYGCQIHEYFYWILMANLDALAPSLTDKCRSSDDEWHICNRAELEQLDVLAFDLLNNHGFSLPDRIPDGNYSPKVSVSQEESAVVTPVAAHDQATSGPQNIPVYDPTFCPGADVAGHLVQMNEPLIDCLIEANKSDTPPVVVAGAAMDPAAVTQVHEALDAGIEILGGWGPLHIVMVGINDPDHIMLAEHLCGIYDKNGLHVRGGSLETCITETADEFSRYDCCGAAHNPPEPLSPVGLQSIQFSAPEISAAEGRLRATTLHEYVHVFQNAQTVWPNELDSDADGRIRVYGHGMVWMEEGSAEFFAQYFAGQRGWTDYRANMVENLLSAKKVRSEWGVSLRDVETRDGQARVRELCDCGGMLYYETGTWATAWLVNRSSIDAFLVDYFPRLSYDGWEVTFQNAFGLTMDEFYTEFDAFLDLPIDEQMSILP